MIGFLLRRSFWRGLPLGIVCALVAFAITHTRWHIGLNEWLNDGLFSQRGARSSQANIVLIGLDDQSLAEFSKPLVFLSPELAEVVRYLDTQGAAAIGIDLMVPEDLSELPELANPGSAGDARSFGRVIAQVGKVVLPQWVLLESPLRPLLQWQLKYLNDSEPTDLGFVDLSEDRDRFIRRQRLFVDPGEGDILPHFALALLAKARKTVPTWDRDTRTLRIGEEIIPIDEEGQLRINYVGPPETFPVIPFRSVLVASRNGIELPKLRDAIVIVGVTARGSQDYHSTPYSNQYARFGPTDEFGLMNGPEIHAHVLATLMDRAYLSTPSWLEPLPLLLVCGILLAWILVHFGIEWGLLFALTYYFVWKAVALWAFRDQNVLIPLLALIVVGILVYIVTVTLRWRLLRRILRAVKSQPIAKAFETDLSRLHLGGENRVVTVLFADIRGFTSFSERNKAEPQKVVSLLNAYFTAIVPLIERHGGTLNQYMGDGIMVLFNAPDEQPDHAARAVRAARAMVQAVHEQQAKWTKLGFENLRIGVGINTGHAVVGAVGSPQRLDYSAIGDTTNTAARIEAENKQHGTEILISQQTLQAIPPKLLAELGIDPTTPIVASMLKGKSEVPHLFAVSTTKMSVSRA